VIGAVSFLPIFVIGVGLAILEPALRGPTSKLRVAPGLLCLVSLVLIISYWPAEWVALHGMGHVSRVGPVTRVFGLVGVALLIALALVNPVLSRGLSRPGMRWLGSRSFSLYLVHEPIIVTLAFVWRLASVPAWFVVVGVTCSLVAAEGFFRAVERPTLLLLRRIRQPRLQTGGSRAPDSVA